MRHNKDAINLIFILVNETNKFCVSHYRVRVLKKPLERSRNSCHENLPHLRGFNKVACEECKKEIVELITIKACFVCATRQQREEEKGLVLIFKVVAVQRRQKRGWSRVWGARELLEIEN